VRRIMVKLMLTVLAVFAVSGVAWVLAAPPQATPK
jgi:hypothetical protein